MAGTNNMPVTVGAGGAPSDFKMFVDNVFGDPSKLSTLSTTDESGNRGNAMIVENSSGFKQRKIVQIKFDNTGSGNADQILRIGGLAATAGAAQLFNLPAGAADDPVILDQYGAGCKFTQGLGLMTQNSGLYIRDFQVLSTVDNSPQLDESIIRRRLYFNGDSVPITDVAAATFEMSDQRKNMMKDREAIFYLSALDFLEYTILAGSKGTIIFEIVGADLSVLMNVLK
jgi:hypothetical protein